MPNLTQTSVSHDTAAAYMCVALGDTAVALLKAGAECDKRDNDGYLALDLAPDKEVSEDSSLHPIG